MSHDCQVDRHTFAESHDVTNVTPDDFAYMFHVRASRLTQHQFNELSVLVSMFKAMPSSHKLTLEFKGVDVQLTKKYVDRDEPIERSNHGT